MRLKNHNNLLLPIIECLVENDIVIPQPLFNTKDYIDYSFLAQPLFTYTKYVNSIHELPCKQQAFSYKTREHILKKQVATS